MKSGKLLTYSTTVAMVIAAGLFLYLVKASKALSYLSSDPKACINCHVMNTQYATWQHSSHARRVRCVDCHLPAGDLIARYLAKARDGWNHATAFTLNTYRQRITISADGADRVEANCISCHAKLVLQIRANGESYHAFYTFVQARDRRCWSCHRSVPHGRARGLASTPDNLGVREQREER